MDIKKTLSSNLCYRFLISTLRHTDVYRDETFKTSWFLSKKENIHDCIGSLWLSLNEPKMQMLDTSNFNTVDIMWREWPHWHIPHETDIFFVQTYISRYLLYFCRSKNKEFEIWLLTLMRTRAKLLVILMLNSFLLNCTKDSNQDFGKCYFRHYRSLA